MSAALGTLPFIATLWLLVVLGAAILEESGAKIAAALKRQQQPRLVQPTQVRVRVRTPALRPSSTAAEPLRAAA